MSQLIIRKITRTVCLLFLLCAPLNGFSQLKDAFSIPDCFVTQHEKVFVHLGQHVIVPGEALLYKAYVVNASTHIVSPLSKILYFELTAGNNKPVMFWRAAVNNGVAVGEVPVADTLSTGIYKLKAYTNWMRNTSSEFYFTTNILVTRLSDAEKANLKQFVNAESMQKHINLYPEGGTLVDGLESNIAMKISGLDAEKSKLSGFVADNLGNHVATISIGDNRLALASFTPDIAHTYHVDVTDSVSTVSQQLDDIQMYGALFSVRVENGLVTFTVRQHLNQLAPAKAYTLLLRQRGRVLIDSTIRVEGPQKQFSIAQQRLPDGVVHALLVDNHVVVSQCLVYSQKPKAMEVICQVPDSAVPSKSAIQVQLCNTSASVYRTSVTVRQLNPVSCMAQNTDIDSYLHFYSEVASGSLLSCMPETLDTRTANDWLRVTPISQYLWKTDRAPMDSCCKYMLENKGFILSGIISSRELNKPLGHVLISLSNPDSIPVLDYCETDSVGKFYFLVSPAYDNKDLILSVVNEKDTQNVVWAIDGKNGVHEQPSQSGFTIDNEGVKYIENYKKVALVNAIFYPQDEQTGKTQKATAVHRPFYDRASYTVFPAEYSELLGFKEIVDNLLRAVKFKEHEQEYGLYCFDYNGQEYFKKQATVLVNGVFIDNLEYIANFGTKDIKKIEVVNNITYYGKLTFYGIISITTFDGRYPEFTTGSSAILLKNRVAISKPAAAISGLSVGKATSLPDLRQILYINQELQLKARDTYRFNVVASQLKGRYVIDIEGVSDEGVPLSEKREITIR